METATAPNRPKSYYLQALLATSFCFFPLGIVSIFYSIKAREAEKRGDFDAARNAVSLVKRFILYSVIVGIILGGLNFLTMLSLFKVEITQLITTYFVFVIYHFCVFCFIRRYYDF